VGDLRRAWATKADDPALAPYLTLVDPERRAAPEDDGAGPATPTPEDGHG
jgi:hypothetical protein